MGHRKMRNFPQFDAPAFSLVHGTVLVAARFRLEPTFYVHYIPAV